MAKKRPYRLQGEANAQISHIVEPRSIHVRSDNKKRSFRSIAWVPLTIICFSLAAFGRSRGTTVSLELLLQTRKSTAAPTSSTSEAISVKETVLPTAPPESAIQPLNSEPIPILSFACHYSRYKEILEQVTSYLRNSPKTSTVHYVFTEEDLFQDLSRRMAELMNRQSETTKRLHKVQVLLMETAKEGEQYNLMGFQCASARLYTPKLFQFANVPLPDRLLYIDSDCLVTTELNSLWEYATAQFQAHPQTIFMIAQESRPEDTHHQGLLSCCAPVEVTLKGESQPTTIHMLPSSTKGLNSGVMVMDMKQWDERNLKAMVNHTLQFEQDYKDQGIEIMYGDQGVLNFIAAQAENEAVWKDYWQQHALPSTPPPPAWLELPGHWNLRWDNYLGGLAGLQQQGGGIFHGNRRQFAQDKDDVSPPMNPNVFKALILGGKSPALDP